MPHPNAVLRRAGVEDAAALATVHVRSWRFAYRDFLPAAYLASLDEARHAERYWRPALEGARPSSATWLAEAGGAPIGLVAIEGPEGVPAGEEALPGCGYVHHIHVVPEHLGTGVGALLWRTALEAIRVAGHRDATLAVYEPNARARAFYEAHGWRADGWSAVRVFRWDGGEASVTMLRYRGPTVA
jgi:GNAT superfamily N-acetyltransferase